MTNSNHGIFRKAAILGVPLAFAALGSAVWAQSESQPAMMTTLICRTAHEGETATAKMTNASTLLVCRPFAVSLHMADGSLKNVGSVTVKPQPGPDYAKAVTPAEFTAAYNRWVEKTFFIERSP